jgi:SAM-dependent methyltransferase
MSTTEQDYVLGTHGEELHRLGLQHRVWRPWMVNALRRAGVTVGSRVIDVGAGPGFATVDLAEMVADRGEVAAVERSARFCAAALEALARHRLHNVRVHELDLMSDPMPVTGYDVAWCRWVASFVPRPDRLVQAVREALRPGGRVVFHEYADYGTWRLAPRRPAVEAFVAEVMASWKATGGEPDVALRLPALLQAGGFRLRRVEPILFAVHPADFRWRWPASFLESNLRRLHELGRVDGAWCEEVRGEWATAEADPTTVLLTPLVLEVIAEKGSLVGTAAPGQGGLGPGAAGP